MNYSRYSLGKTNFEKIAVRLAWGISKLNAQLKNLFLPVFIYNFDFMIRLPLKKCPKSVGVIV